MREAQWRRSRYTRRDLIAAIVFSIVLGLALWLFARGEVEIERRIEATLYLTADQGTVVQPSSFPLTVVLRGSKTVVESMGDVHGSYRVPPSDEDKRITLPLDRKHFNLPPEVAVAFFIPSEVEFNVSILISRSVPIRLTLTGQPDPGFVANEETSSVSPAEAVLTGPRSVLANPAITHVPTEPVSLAFRSSPFTVSQLNIDTLALGPGLRTPTRATARVVIESKRSNRTFENCPVRILLPPNAAFLPVIKKPVVTVELSGPADALATLKPGDILVYARIDKPQPTPFYVDCAVHVPPGMALTLVGLPPRVAVDNIVEVSLTTSGES
ncbi:MAG: hypothetical protein V2A58_14775 [Planctomycetota bacterium]